MTSPNTPPAAPEVRADPVELTRLADQFLKSSQQIGDAWRQAQGSLAPPATAYGDSAGGPGAHTAHETTADAAGVAFGRLIAVLEGDMDRLYRVAFAYQAADEAEARKLHPHHGRNDPDFN